MNQPPLLVLKEALVESGLLQGSLGAQWGQVSLVRNSDSSRWRPVWGCDLWLSHSLMNGL